MKEEYETKGNVGFLAFVLVLAMTLCFWMTASKIDQLEQRIQKLEQIVEGK